MKSHDRRTLFNLKMSLSLHLIPSEHRVRKTHLICHLRLLINEHNLKRATLTHSHKTQNQISTITLNTASMIWRNCQDCKQRTQSSFQRINQLKPRRRISLCPVRLKFQIQHLLLAFFSLLRQCAQHNRFAQHLQRINQLNLGGIGRLLLLRFLFKDDHHSQHRLRHSRPKLALNHRKPNLS
ncbi:hypothetical protein BLNAU_19815 [Blattamonas nauphoetae]|uniref:Uncharacterized protein n=1 Tax=Blattamonas nauphoetae TaxID=2049346 RepID=A0ABQ9X0E6_9EUKA|nr:hypothetical protein BLNAU_19815 [Blattamonas nauphoetae]